MPVVELHAGRGPELPEPDGGGQERARQLGQHHDAVGAAVGVAGAHQPQLAVRRRLHGHGTGQRGRRPHRLRAELAAPVHLDPDLRHAACRPGAPVRHLRDARQRPDAGGDPGHRPVDLGDLAQRLHRRRRPARFGRGRPAPAQRRRQERRPGELGAAGLLHQRRLRSWPSQLGKRQQAEAHPGDDRFLRLGRRHHDRSGAAALRQRRHQRVRQHAHERRAGVREDDPAGRRPGTATSAPLADDLEQTVRSRTRCRPTPSSSATASTPRSWSPTASPTSGTPKGALVASD